MLMKIIIKKPHKLKLNKNIIYMLIMQKDLITIQYQKIET